MTNFSDEVLRAIKAKWPELGRFLEEGIAERAAQKTMSQHPAAGYVADLQQLPGRRADPEDGDDGEEDKASDPMSRAAQPFVDQLLGRKAKPKKRKPIVPEAVRLEGHKKSGPVTAADAARWRSTERVIKGPAITIRER